jgi:nucleotidyltransferase substrate binding protein (TIGR01987 family)
MTSQKKDIRWIQGFSRFKLAFSQLKEAQQMAQSRPLNNLEKQGLIQSFEFTHEIAWKVLKDYMEVKGGLNLIGSKDTLREAFQKNLVTDGESWMEMIKSRNLTSHTYNENTANLIIGNILTRYIRCFEELDQKMLQFLP